MPQCHYNNLTKAKVLCEISVLVPFLYFPCFAFGFCLSVLLLCLQSWHSLPLPSSMDGRMVICFPPAITDCLLRDMARHPSSVAPCSGVVSAQHPERPQRNCPKHRPHCSQPRGFALCCHLCLTLIGVSREMELLSGADAQSREAEKIQGMRRELGTVTYGGGDAEGYCQKQNVWQLLGTDLHCKYYSFHSNIKLESKASVLVELFFVFILLGNTMVCAVCCLTETSLSSVMKRFCWSLAKRIWRELSVSVLRTGISLAAWMLSWGHAEQLSIWLCASLAHLQ